MEEWCGGYRKDALSPVNTIGYGSIRRASSPAAFDSNNAWNVHFDNGNSNNDNRDNAHHVRLVRGGE